VYNGKTFNQVEIKSKMIGHSFLSSELPCLGDLDYSV
jgi:hypothetical protein